MRLAYRGRFAPSPTGALHLGSARTALVAWLRARSAGGRLVMRVEDLDPPRVVSGAADAILADLRWLGLDWDEGPDVGGPHAPYVQSARGALYDDAIARLARSGFLYPCTCSRREIASIASAPHGPADDGPRYPGTCRVAPSHPGRPAALRFRMPDPAPGFTDAIHGVVAASPGADDFVVRRADGLFAYQLAVVVDDAAMGVTEVVRGEDLLASTPRQIALFRALGHEPPAFAHVPLVLGPDGTRLAKRHGAISIASTRDRGLAPEQVVGAIASTLGLVARGASVAPVDLVARFDLARVPRTPVALADLLA